MVGTPLSPQEPQVSRPESSISAQELFRAAYENRYTWDQGFPGYTADVTYTHNGQSHRGQVRVGADLKSSVMGVADETAQKAIQSQLFEVAIHRVRRSFAETHGQNIFRYGETLADGSVEILMGGKAEGDKYQVRRNQISMVHRHIHSVVVTIHTWSSHDTGSGYLSHRYDSIYHDPKTGEPKGGLNHFEDHYEHVGGYYLLSGRRIETATDGLPDVQEFVFSNLVLITA